MMSARIKISINDGPFAIGLFDIEHERIHIRTLTASKPDPDWTFIDGASHFHAYADDGKLPTLELKSRHIDPPDVGMSDEDVDDDRTEDRSDLDDDYEDFDDDDGWDEQFYACRICGEEIEPKRLPDATEKDIPGLYSWKAEVDGFLPIGQQVSVVVKIGRRLMFGVGLVDRVEPLSIGHARSSIIGNGTVGTKTLAKKPKVKKVKTA